jgi:para-aminobenzoate synthetase component 2
MSTTAGTGERKILVIDNYDSFVFNLVQYLQQLGAHCTVVRNDEFKLIKYCAQKKIPLLGVCLGHQVIAIAYGATVSRAPELLHGKTSIVSHSNKSVLENIPSPFTATRYHSLAIEKDTLPTELEITGQTESGVVMAIQHKTLPISGVQFHPESVLTEHGYQMIGNWLEICGDKGARKKSEKLKPFNLELLG